MTPTAEHMALAREIADALGEHGAAGQAPRARVEAQIASMAALMGAEWVRDFARIAQRLHQGQGPSHKDDFSECASMLVDEPLRQRADGADRSIGGLFFAVARKHAVAHFQNERGVNGKLPREFYETFCWREPTLKPPKSASPKRDRENERAALVLFARRCGESTRSFRVVPEPTDGVWYDWADPATGKVGQCLRDDGKWAQEPLGKAPVLLVWKKPAHIDGIGPSGIAEAGPKPGHAKHTTRGGKGVVGRLHDKCAAETVAVEYRRKR